MQVSDEQLEAMCKAFIEEPPASKQWDGALEESKHIVRVGMRAALATLPEPEPVPGRDLESQLAACPEPVVIDEALLWDMCKAYWTDHNHTEGMRKALHVYLGGDRASVSVPQCEPQIIDSLVDQNSPSFLRAKLEATEEIVSELRAERDKHKAVRARQAKRIAQLEALRREVSEHGLAEKLSLESRRAKAEKERDQLRAELALSERNAREWEAREAKAQEELEKTRAELERERMRLAGCGVAARGYPSECLPEYESDSLDGVRELYRRKEALREQLEALRAACALTDAERDALEKTGGPHPSAKLRHFERFREYLYRVQGALLKPAPAEAEPQYELVDVTYDDLPDDEEPLQHPPPEPTTWEQAMTARVERLERDNALLWSFWEDFPKLERPWVQLVREMLDARKGAP